MPHAFFLKLSWAVCPDSFWTAWIALDTFCVLQELKLLERSWKRFYFGLSRSTVASRCDSDWFDLLFLNLIPETCRCCQCNGSVIASILKVLNEREKELLDLKCTALRFDTFQASKLDVQSGALCVWCILMLYKHIVRVLALHFLKAWISWMSRERRDDMLYISHICHTG